ncbi:DMT family transporter [Chitinimonas sp.]|uniref:DMT family transporter n=1 Tax=Chitinimonas sp. TaxID=1934313 RepID=UPI0035B0A70F
MLLGIFYAVAAGMAWGTAFVAPLMLPDSPALLLSLGRYVAFGLIALAAGWIERDALRQLSRADWLEASKLAAIGNLLYYLCLASAIQYAGAPLPTMIIGTLPVLIAITANLRNVERDGRLPWSRLLPPLSLILLGIACVNQSELNALRAAHGDIGRYLLGGVLACVAAACWTWYPLRNADWLRAHPDRQPRAWANAQGIVTLPMGLVGFALLALASPWLPSAYAAPLGHHPLAYLGVVAMLGIVTSWLGTLFWNEASPRLPTSLAGQLIVFETLAALGFAYLWRGDPPSLLTQAGIALLITGVVWAVRSHQKPATAT